MCGRENKDIHIARGAVVEVGSGSNVYGGVDWVSMAMSANSTSDLTDPAVAHRPCLTLHLPLATRISLQLRCQRTQGEPEIIQSLRHRHYLKHSWVACLRLPTCKLQLDWMCMR